MRRLLALVALGLALAGGAASAGAARVVVLGFSGPKAGKAQRAVERVVARRHDLVSAGQWNKAAAKLRAKKPTNKNVAKVAAKLQVDAIVTGQVVRRGPRYALRVVVREGASGRVAETIGVALKAGGSLSDGDISGRLLAALKGVTPVSGGGGGDGEEEPPRKGKGKGNKGKGREVAEDPVDEPVIDDEDPIGGGGGETPREVARGDGEDPEAGSAIKERRRGGGGGDDGGGATGAALASRRARAAGAELSAGFSAVGRNLAYTHNLPDNQKPDTYRSAPVGGMYVNGEVYPMAFGGKPGALGGLGVTFLYDRVFTLSSKLKSGGGEFDTSASCWGFGVVYRLNIGQKATLPTVKALLGYGHRDFIIDGDMTVTLPDVSYGYLDFGLAGRLPLGSPKFAANLEFKVQKVLSAGEMTDMDKFGGASMLGIDFDVGLEYRPLARLVVKAGGRFTQIGYAFDGSGAMANNLDGDPTSKDVGGATDRYFGGYLTAGWLF